MSGRHVARDTADLGQKIITLARVYWFAVIGIRGLLRNAKLILTVTKVSGKIRYHEDGKLLSRGEATARKMNIRAYWASILIQASF